MAELPIELIEEILLRLPVADLLRFRCVSKKWRNLIDSPNFIQSHMNLPNKPQFVLVTDKKQRIYYFDIDSVSNANSTPNLRKLRKPCCEIYSDMYCVLHHVNGLVCCLCDRFGERGMILWNPWTLKHIEVPPPEERPRILCEGTSLWGFGYDRDSDDYKVLALARLVTDNPSGRCLVWIYSLRSGSWKSLGDSPYPPSDYWQDVVFFDGAFYWIVDSPYDGSRFSSICALHLGKLEYSLVTPPKLSYRTHLGQLGVLDGCLTATCVEHYCTESVLWVMKKYGVKESWTRLMRYHERITPLAYTRNGNGLLFATSDLVMSYEFKTRSFRMVNLPSSFFKSVVCASSFVSPRSDL